MKFSGMKMVVYFNWYEMGIMLNYHVGWKILYVRFLPIVFELQLY